MRDGFWDEIGFEGVVCKSWERFTLVIGLQASKCSGCGCGGGKLGRPVLVLAGGRY